MSYEIEGTIKVIMDTQKFGSGFTKREFVITTAGDRYPQEIKMETVKDKTALLEKYKVGDVVKIGFDIRGSAHNDRYYVSLNVWRIHPSDGTSSPSEGASRTSEPRIGGGGGDPSRPRFDKPRTNGGGVGAGGSSGDRWEKPKQGGGRPKPQDGEFRGGRRSNNDEDDIDF